MISGESASRRDCRLLRRTNEAHGLAQLGEL
jgi:hypothetical protein